MAVKLSPLFNTTQFDNNGLLLNGGKIYWYAAGSTTPQNTYTDNTGNTANPNPIILNSRGEPPNPIWLTAGLTYKAVLTDSLNNTIRTVDNISGVNDTGGGTTSISEWVDSGLTPSYISSASFSLPGDQTGNFQIGRRVRAFVSVGTAYGLITNSVYSAPNTTVTVSIDSGSVSIDSGISAAAYGILSYSTPSVPEVIPGLWSINGLIGVNNSGAPSTKMDFTCNAVTVINSNTHRTKLVWNPGTITCDTGLAGPVANGRDQSGAFPSTAFIHFYYIFNGTTLATICSLTAPLTGPTLPSGYTHWAYIGAISWSVSALTFTYIRGNQFILATDANVLPNGTSPSFASVSLSSWIPSNASWIELFLDFNGGTGASTGGFGPDTCTVAASINDGGTIITQNAVTAASSAARPHNSTMARFANLSQSIKYLVTQNSNATSGPGLYIYVHSYTMPNGAS